MPVIRSKNLIANRSTGGCKKQGLAPSTGKSTAMRKQTMTKASANDKTIYCLNQVGGVGRFRSSTTYGDSAGCFYSVTDAFNDVKRKIQASTSNFGAIIIKDKNTHYVSFYNNTVNFSSINEQLDDSNKNLNNGFHGYGYYNNNDEVIVPEDMINTPDNTINGIPFTLNKFTSLRAISNLDADRMYFFLRYYFDSIQPDDNNNIDSQNNYYKHAENICQYLNCKVQWDRLYFDTYATNSSNIIENILTYKVPNNTSYKFALPTSSKKSICSVFSSLGTLQSEETVLNRNIETVYQYDFLIKNTYIYKLKLYEITIKSFNEISFY